jgi:hypothetical protein
MITDLLLITCMGDVPSLRKAQGQLPSIHPLTLGQLFYLFILIKF